MVIQPPIEVNSVINAAATQPYRRRPDACEERTANPEITSGLLA